MISKSEFQNKTKCIRFVECPLCYKCRGFNIASLKCQKCDIPECSKETHTPKNINMMISRPTIKFNENISFKSFSRSESNA